MTCFPRTAIICTLLFKEILLSDFKLLAILEVMTTSPYLNAKGH